MPFDVVGLGAVNVDVIVPSDRLPTSLLRSLSAAAVDGDDEQAVDSERMSQLLQQLAENRPEIPRRVFRGGSAYNTLWTMGVTGFDLRLGFVGVQGDVTSTGLGGNHRAALQGVGVEPLLTDVASSAGVCLALASAGGRRLFSNPGANIHLATLFDDPATRSGLVDRLTGTGIVHLTGIVEPAADRSPITQALADFVTDLKLSSPETSISVDPGALWVARCEHRALVELFGLADVVFLNREEANALGPNAVEFFPKASMVVHKRPDGVEVVQPREQARTWVPQATMKTAVDPTGAGDAFAAGFLATLDSNRSLATTADKGSIVAASEVGLALAARRVSAWGDTAFGVE